MMIKSTSVIHHTTERTSLICSPNHRALIKDWEAYVLYVHKVPFHLSLVQLIVSEPVTLNQLLRVLSSEVVIAVENCLSYTHCVTVCAVCGAVHMAYGVLGRSFPFCFTTVDESYCILVFTLSSFPFPRFCKREI